MPLTASLPHSSVPLTRSSTLGAKSVTYSFNAEVAGNYSIRAVMAGSSDTNPGAPITVTDSAGTITSFAMDQSVDWQYDQLGTVQVRACTA
jgi:hypothetical protein